MGRNGSGKSTLLKLLSRITSPTGGTMRIRGRVASLLEVGTGFNYELTGKENVYLNGSILGLKQQQIDDRYRRILDFAEIDDFMDTPVKRYSSGMRVRLAFAVAAHLEPEILILDEVLAVGDAKFQEKCLNRINEIKNAGVTVLFVSHSAQSVRNLCTKGIVLKDGLLQMQGTATEAVAHYLEALHLGSGETLGSGYPESRAGIQAGQCAKILVGSTRSEGHIVFNIAVETSDGLKTIDVGWVSAARFKTLRTEPAWSAAPDVCVAISSHARMPDEAEREGHFLLKSGARETWIVSPNGKIRRTKSVSDTFFVQDCPAYLPAL
jgi:ABC-type polysaccharide/polyol phosphate transport system ATPase subunit